MIPNKISKKFLTLFSFLLLTTSLFSQEEQSAEELFKLSLEELLRVKIVTSAKDEQEVWQASSKTIVINEKMIKEGGYFDLLDVLKSSPYFQVQSEHAHWTKGAIVNLAGFRSGDAGNNKVLLLIDGIKISDDGGEGLYMGLNSIPINFVKQIEIVYGPNSTMYGRDAYAGMINIITKTEDFAGSGYAYGSFNSQRIYGNIKREIAEGFNGHLYFNSYKSNEQNPLDKSITYKNRHVFSHHPYTERFYRAQNNLFFDVGLKYKGLALTYIRYDVEGSETYGSNPDLYVTEYSTQSYQINSILSLRYAAKLNNVLDFESYYTFKKYEFDPRSANLYTDDLNRFNIDTTNSLISIDPLYAYGGRKYYYFRTISHKAGIKPMWQISGKLRNVSGIDFNFINGIPVISEGKGGKPITTDEQRKRFEHNSNTIGIYSEFSYRLNDNLLATAGGRFDFNSKYPNTFMPRVAMIGKFDNHVLKLMFSKGYLAPSITQTYFESITTFSWIKPNENLKPEKNTSISGDWSFIFGRTHLTANVFYSKLDDAIIESVQSGDSSYVYIEADSFYVPILQSKNISSGYRAGISVAVYHSFSELVSFDLNYSYLSGQDNLPGKTIRIEDNLVSTHSLNLGINLSYKQFNLNSELRYSSNRRIKSEHNKTAYSTLLNADGYLIFEMPLLVNITLRASGIGDGLNAFVRITNVFNAEYYGQTINAGWGSPKVLQDMRRIDAGIEYEM